MNDFIQIRGLSIHVEMEGEPHLPTIIFLHGFTGSTATWREVRDQLKGSYRTIAIDMTGHGKTTIPENPERYAMEEQIEDLNTVIERLSIHSFYLVGYSMGGRIALAYTIHYPERVRSLILESASPGLKEETEREKRKHADALLAKKIIENGITSFVDKWESIPLFDSQKSLPEKKRDSLRTERLQQSEKGLANSLLGIGTGSQQSYWDDLGTIKKPVYLITGELDTKFVGIAREMKKLVPICRHFSVSAVGHAIHVENPHFFATMIKEYVQDIHESKEEENDTSMGNNPYI
ncbi:2-succinyl-6-hydroxy-2,4-cyclohexadiene-1-carboxylate synthase [Sporosarcina highlanderae]|uniref:Putative 2-succinyl-6-hydroxy-2,4-cyclohexadiene-1-carboxylate synthase n=1 Tax=Sporosarcina highlanderae TaxID=3035916 RepID=A0ABT8JRR6_9BACL|nr:2-succinyl-6-hydroxy-2,4-cyclohexadiene-1-carboxylate synthase [Sporosarcina highlanderae]MDN4607800.1 2-succinyl-6-hydroxy-2,4-cyclohexadiene-1-carboxylate synthase [Sporosarcina highlanderae]